MNERIRQWPRVQSFYKKAFEIRWGETWYASVIQPIILSVEENEKLRKRSEETFPSMEKEWRPYELIIETQIGLVLILCQTYITNVISQVQNLHNDFRAIFKTELTGITKTKRNLLKLPATYYEKTGYTKIEAIDHLANYFKHHQEWGGRSQSLKLNAKNTAKAIQELGLKIDKSLWYSRNLTNALRPLGVSVPSELPTLLTIVDEWKMDIGLHYKNLLSDDRDVQEIKA